MDIRAVLMVLTIGSCFLSWNIDLATVLTVINRCKSLLPNLCRLMCQSSTSEGACKNGGHDQTTSTCPPGYSGDLCDKKMDLKEDRLDTLEKRLEQLTAKLALAETKLNDQSKQIEIIGAGQGKWKLYRANEIFNQLEKLELHQSTPNYRQKMPFVLPKGTQAILISVFCNFRNKNGHAYLNYEAHQTGNDNPEAKVYGYNTHYNVNANTFYYEQMIPWDSALPNEMSFKVISSYNTGGAKNWYRVRLVGYVTFN